HAHNRGRFEKSAGHAAVDSWKHRVADDLWREGHHKRAILVDANTETTREGTVGEKARRIIRRIKRRRFPLLRLLFRHHCGPVRTDHEAGGCGGDRMIFGFLVGRRAHKGDRAGYAEANRMSLDIEARSCRLLVIDAQVKGCYCASPIKRKLNGHAAALVEHSG